MTTWICKTDSQGNLVPPPTAVGDGFHPKTVAEILGWASGTWRVITEDEAHDLQKPSPEEARAAMQQAFTAAIQERLDAFAQTRMWDDAASCALRVSSPVPQYALEARYMLDSMDYAWSIGTNILNAVLAGERPMPTLEEVMAELPELAWPDEHYAV